MKNDRNAEGVSEVEIERFAPLEKAPEHLVGGCGQGIVLRGGLPEKSSSGEGATDDRYD